MSQPALHFLNKCAISYKDSCKLSQDWRGKTTSTLLAALVLTFSFLFSRVLPLLPLHHPVGRTQRGGSACLSTAGSISEHSSKPSVSLPAASATASPPRSSSLRASWSSQSGRSWWMRCAARPRRKMNATRSCVVAVTCADCSRTWRWPPKVQ